MNVGKIVYGNLMVSPAVAAIAGDRVAPVGVDQELDLPAVAYVVQLGEGNEGTAPVQRVIVSAHCLAHSESQAHDLAEACDGVLNGLAGRDGGTILSELSRMGRQPDYNQEFNLWSVSLSYEGLVTY